MLVIIVPFRSLNQPERLKQLSLFLSHMRQKIPAAYIFIMEQADNRLFNRGALLNAGVDVAGISDHDIVCFHDIDLLPMDDIIDEYLIPLSKGTVRHIGAAWKRYDSKSYLGGILMMHKGDFMHINGFPNNFWGWGGEDDELRDRINSANLTIEKSKGTIIDLENLTLQQKLKTLKKTKQKCMNKWETRRWHKENPTVDGIASANYKILYTQMMLDKNTFYYQIQIC